MLNNKFTFIIMLLPLNITTNTEKFEEIFLRCAAKQPVKTSHGGQRLCFCIYYSCAFTACSFFGEERSFWSYFPDYSIGRELQSVCQSHII